MVSGIVAVVVVVVGRAGVPDLGGVLPLVTVHDPDVIS